MTRRADVFLRWTALALFIAAVVAYGWNSDDAYHSYVMAKHLAEGKGLVYNAGFRVTASTCPLLTLLEAFVFTFTDSADVCALLTGVLFSAAAAWLLIFRISPSAVVSFCLSCVMVSSRCFLSFTTSGLENPMLFFFGAAFFGIYFRGGDFSKRHLLAISSLLSLLALTRADSVLVFVPMAVWAYLVRTKVAWHARSMLGLAGLSLFAAWTLFSVLYYGFPFPNTYYAKIYTGIPMSEYIVRGMKYFPASWVVDPMLLIVPVFSAVLAVKARKVASIPLFIGLAAYSVYVVAIGGDFMAGRHLTQQFFLSVCLCALLAGGNECRAVSETKRADGFAAKGKVIGSTMVLCLVGCLWNYGDGAPLDGWPFANKVVDERHFYLTAGGDVPLIKAVWRGVVHGDGSDRTFRDEYRRRRILDAREKGHKGLCFNEVANVFCGPVLFGKDVFASLDLDMCLTDVIALQDPLLARLKVHSPGDWRVGHLAREMPHGYSETLASGENLIEDPSLRAYYDKLLLVMKGPLFDRERLRAVFELNCGKFDNLLEQYERNCRASRAAATAR